MVVAASFVLEYSVCYKTVVVFMFLWIRPQILSYMHQAGLPVVWRWKLMCLHEWITYCHHVVKSCSLLLPHQVQHVQKFCKRNNRYYRPHLTLTQNMNGNMDIQCLTQ
jgi:hypothetical protein